MKAAVSIAPDGVLQTVAEFQTVWTRWMALDGETPGQEGWTECKAWNELLRQIIATRAQTLLGVKAKLEIALKLAVDPDLDWSDMVRDLTVSATADIEMQAAVLTVRRGTRGAEAAEFYRAAGLRLERLRRHLGHTPDSFAAMIGLSAKVYPAYERGERSRGWLRIVVPIVHATGVSLDWLLRPATHGNGGPPIASDGRPIKPRLRVVDAKPDDRPPAA